MGKPAMFGSLDEVLQLSRDIPGVLPCIDFAHLHARTGQLNSYGEFMSILDAVEAALGERGLISFTRTCPALPMDHGASDITCRSTKPICAIGNCCRR